MCACDKINQDWAIGFVDFLKKYVENLFKMKYVLLI